MTKWRFVAAFAGLTLLATACGGESGADDNENADPQASAPADTETDTEEPAPADEGGDQALSGTIEIDGSSTVAPLTDAIAEEYANEQSDVTVNLGVSGSGGGFERFCGTGDTDISNASRPIKQEEADLCEENGISFIEVRVGTDALTMVTSPETDFVECLTTDEVIAIFGPDGASNWSEVRSDLPDEPLTIFAPGTDSGTYDFMVEDALGIESARQDFQASEDDNIIVQGVQGTPGSWGFFGYAYYQENADSVKALAYDAGEGCVEPSVETAQDDSYKLTRPLFIYVKEESLQTKDHVADFVQFYLETVNSVIEEVGYIPAPDEEIADATSTVESSLQG